MPSRHLVLILAACLVGLPAAAQAQGRDRQQPPPSQGGQGGSPRGGQADRGRQERPRSPDADRPREQPKSPPSREPQLKRRKP